MLYTCLERCGFQTSDYSSVSANHTCKYVMMQETCGKHVKYVTGECMLFVPIRKEDNDNFDNCNAKDGRTTLTKIQKKTKKLLDLLNVMTLKRVFVRAI